MPNWPSLVSASPAGFQPFPGGQVVGVDAGLVEQGFVVEGELPDIDVKGHAPHLAVPPGRFPRAGEEVVLADFIGVGNVVIQRFKGVGYGKAGVPDLVHGGDIGRVAALHGQQQALLVFGVGYGHDINR